MNWNVRLYSAVNIDKFDISIIDILIFIISVKQATFNQAFFCLLVC